MRRLLPLLALALAAGVLAGAAPASRDCAAPAGDHSLCTAHFTVGYYTDVNPKTEAPGDDYSTETQAGDIAAYAERAYAIFTSWGYTAPATPIDITLTSLTPTTVGATIEGYADATGITLATPTEIGADFTSVSGLSLADEEQKVVANEVFVVFELQTWAAPGNGDYWLLDGAAQWAAFQSIGYPSGSVLTTLGPPDIALDCRDDLSAPSPPLLPYRMCDPVRWTEQGYTRWAFFQLLANKYGPSFVKNVLADGASGMSATSALSAAIAAKGSSLASVFTNYTSDLLNGNFGVTALSGVRPSAYEDVTVGAETVPVAPATAPVTVDTIPVDHLAARYVTFERGDGDGSHTCYAAKLTVNVSLRYGAASQSFSSISSQPYFYWDVSGSTPQALSISGSTASITVPWDTCDWGSATHAYLSLPNASTSIDAADFTVTMTQTVDTNTPANATPPPSPTSIWGTTVPVPTTDVAPTIDVFGPALLKLSATSRVIRLIVDSSDVGSLNATLGSTALGTSQLRAGNNDVRYTVPASLVASLRSSASAKNVLTLTPMSPSGASAGTPVTRNVTIATPVKAKPKPKPKKPKK